MKKIKIIISILLSLSMLLPAATYAQEGVSGYEGGISSGEVPNKVSYDYQEVCFLTGDPIVLKGTLLLKKSVKQNNIVSVYTYNLKNLDKSATLTRSLTINTKVTKKDNGQSVEESTLTGRTSEIVKIKNTTYTLQNYDFTRSNLIDAKPAVNYYAGDIWGKKTYQTGTAATGAGTITVEETGNFYGYDQYWGTTEVEMLNYIIESEKKNGTDVDKWGGSASVNLSSTSEKEIKYVENEPNQISFKGGYIQVQHNESVLEYNCKLPEFDSKGISTDTMIDTKGSLKLETFPVQTRMPVPNLNHLRGHWAEEDVKMLYSLEVFKGNDTLFNPEQYMSRAEFATAILGAAKEVPIDPALASKTVVKKPSTSTTKQQVLPVFGDVSPENLYFSQIETAYKRGLMDGVGENNFLPNDTLTVAQAVAVFIRALGLEGMAPNPVPVTTFKDNDKIPKFARNSVYVAEKIGLIHGDEKGYIHPIDQLTKGEAASLLNRFIDYMREGIRKDYRENLVNY